MKIATRTLGCKLNFAETSNLHRKFCEAGHTLVEFHEVADLYIINTCTVTAIAEKKCRNAIRQACHTNPKAQVAVIGCFAQNEADKIAQIPGVTHVIGNHNKQNLINYINGTNQTPFIDTQQPQSFEPAYSSGDRTRTFFKIQDGCDYFCSYCAIPFARGRSRSATIEQTVAVARQIAETGTKEVVLTGVNTGTFGQIHNEQFIDLLKQLDQIEGIERFRISSIEPNLITTDIIDFMANSRAFLPHFHIPIQAASDKVLKLMHRRYDTQLYAQRINHIKESIPHACIAADIMTGFYGETDDDFNQSMQFIKSIPISYLHVFTYSERPNTAALKMEGKVPVPIRRQRSQMLHQLSELKKNEFLQSQLGQSRPVLWESNIHQVNGADYMQGWTDNYIRLQQPYSHAQVNTITMATINDTTIVNNINFDN